MMIVKSLTTDVFNHAPQILMSTGRNSSVGWAWGGTLRPGPGVAKFARFVVLQSRISQRRILNWGAAFAHGVSGRAAADRDQANPSNHGVDPQLQRHTDSPTFERLHLAPGIRKFPRASTHSMAIVANQLAGIDGFSQESTATLEMYGKAVNRRLRTTACSPGGSWSVACGSSSCFTNHGISTAP